MGGAGAPSLVAAVASFDANGDGKLDRADLKKLAESVQLNPEDVWNALVHYADFEVNSDDEDVSPRKLKREEVEKLESGLAAVEGRERLVEDSFGVVEDR